MAQKLLKRPGRAAGATTPRKEATAAKGSSGCERKGRENCEESALPRR